jgi:hypothetical protein
LAGDPGAWRRGDEQPKRELGNFARERPLFPSLEACPEHGPAGLDDEREACLGTSFESWLDYFPQAVEVRIRIHMVERPFSPQCRSCAEGAYILRQPHQGSSEAQRDGEGSPILGSGAIARRGADDEERWVGTGAGHEREDVSEQRAFRGIPDQVRKGSSPPVSLWVPEKTKAAPVPSPAMDALGLAKRGRTAKEGARQFCEGTSSTGRGGRSLY